MKKYSDIPVFILAGGLGTRISEETQLKPKPMVEIGGVPILVHIMRWYYSFGFNDFVICAGYRSWEIKDYFLSYQFRQNSLCIDHRENVTAAGTSMDAAFENEKWRVRVVDTGIDTMTGGRLAKALALIKNTDRFDTFAVTYGDGLCNVDLHLELDHHLKSGKIGTVLGVPPVSRFGEMEISQTGLVEQFLEKPESRKGLINGGFFFFNSQFQEFLGSNEATILEREPLEKLVDREQLTVYPHRDFWQCMDTLRDKNHLQEVWDKGCAPWFPSNKGL